MSNHHFLLLSCPSQGHLNPTLELAKKLTRAPAQVTLATTVHGLRRITTALPAIPNLSYATFSNGHDDGPDPAADPASAMSELRSVGSKTLAQLLTTLSVEGRPVTFIIYAVLLPWAATVAREFHIRSAFLSIQSATTFAIYHKYFNAHDGLYPDKTTPPVPIKLPGMPLFSPNEIPSFLLPDSPFASVIPTFQEHIQTLETEQNPLILANTFDELEQDSIGAVDRMTVIPIGPLVPTDGQINLFEQDTDYTQWLDSKPEKSVVYVSFGSMAVLSKNQIEQIFHGLVKSQRPFLWVIRRTEYTGETRDLIEAGLKGSNDGLVVPWCSQFEVLRSGSVGCFLTHCGWNSMLESLVAGVPVVGCPQLSDQMTNAKMVEEVWGNGVRAAVNGEGVVEGKEVGRCLEVVMGGGERGQGIRSKCSEWKGLGKGALVEGGSSHTNLERFLERLV